VAERPALEAVLFDAGGTLIRLDFEWMSADLAAQGLQVSAAALRRAEVEGRRRYDASVEQGRRAPADPASQGARPERSWTGIGDQNAYFGGMLEAAGVPREQFPAALERFAARQRGPGLWTRPMEGARAALDGIGALGLQCGVVSNSDGRARLHLADCDMLRGLDVVVDSHEVGIEKPDPGIFFIARTTLGAAAPRTLFVGDIRATDEAGARAAGLHFVLVDPHGDYGEHGTPAIAGLEQLPDFVRARFTPAPRARTRDPRGPKEVTP